jgi:hypothetical protein
MPELKQIRILRYVVTLGLLLTFAAVPVVQAAQSSSNNYSVNEVFFGTGGQLCDPGNADSAHSTTYCAKTSAGELTVGNTASNSYQAQAGFNTDREPSLTFIVPTQSVNLGVLKSGTTATATATFSVKSYLTSGYVVQTVGQGLTNSGHVLQNMATPAAITPTAEQFGINLVANTCPAGATGCSGALGANPGQAPDATFGFGQAAHTSASDYYDQANQYMYKDGDVIAQSLKSSGTTNYTISYIANISPVTPGGTYTMDQILVATATF